MNNIMNKNKNNIFDSSTCNLPEIKVTILIFDLRYVKVHFSFLKTKSNI